LFHIFLIGEFSEIQRSILLKNDYLWNTAVYFDLFYFWELKSTMCGIGALTVFASNNNIEWVIKFPQTFLCPRHSKNGGGALSVTPVRAFVRPSVRPSVIKIWCLLNNFWKTASIQFKFGMLTYNIKTQVKFDLGYNSLIFDGVFWWAFYKKNSTKIGVRSVTFERLHQFDSYLACWYIISKHRSSSIWVTIH